MMIDRRLKTGIGALCGSEYVNIEFAKWLKNGNAGDFGAKCEALGISQVACLREACAQFERIKLEFWSGDKRNKKIHLDGKDDAELWSWVIKLTKYVVYTAHRLKDVH